MAVLPFDSRKQLNGAFERSRRFLAGFTSGQKTVTLIALAGVVLGGMLFLTHSSSPNYTTLFANLQPQAAGQVTQQLTNDHIPYELTNGGTTVLVPEQDVNQERITLAESGLPSGGTITFQTLAGTGITSSSFVQDVEYQQALASQLQSAIDTMQGVQNAQVSLVVPQQSTFAVTNQTAPSASVLVALQPGVTLSGTQVEAIVHLTASAVPGLSPANVTVVDNQGDVLSAPGVDTSASQDQQQAVAYDQLVESNISTLLTRLVGADNAAVQVHAVLNFAQQSQQTTGFQLGKNGKPVTVPTTKSNQTQTYNGNNPSQAGIAGSGQPPATTNQSGNYKTSSNSANYAYGTSSSTTQIPPGQVQATSVAVVLNSSVKRLVTPASLTQIRNLVTAAAGLNLKGADSLVVSALPFAANSPAVPAAVKQSIVTKLKSVAPSAALVLLVLGLFFAALVVSKRRAPRFEEIPLAQLGPGGSGAIPIGAGRFTDPAELDTGEVPAINGSDTLASLMPAVGPVPAHVEGYIKENPSEVAQLMRNWSRERGARGGSGSGAPATAGGRS